MRYFFPFIFIEKKDFYCFIFSIFLDKDTKDIQGGRNIFKNFRHFKRWGGGGKKG